MLAKRFCFVLKPNNLKPSDLVATILFVASTSPGHHLILRSWVTTAWIEGGGQRSVIIWLLCRVTRLQFLPLSVPESRRN